MTRELEKQEWYFIEELSCQITTMKKHYENIVAESFKEKIIVKYKQSLLKQILESFSVRDVKTRLQEILFKNWNFVKNTRLCYTAMPEDDLTLLLCDLAELIKTKDRTALALLMPNVSDIPLFK